MADTCADTMADTDTPSDTDTREHLSDLGQPVGHDTTPCLSAIGHGHAYLLCLAALSVCPISDTSLLNLSDKAGRQQTRVPSIHCL